MERYQLSQDFQEKQLQLLQRKYGGAEKAGGAALTIQRAFRRYSMAKKFAHLTAHVKGTEKRFSRRLEYDAAAAAAAAAAAPPSGGGVPGATASYAVGGGPSGGLPLPQSHYPSPPQPPPAQSAQPHHYHHHHHHHHHHRAHHRNYGVAPQPSPAPLHASAARQRSSRASTQVPPPPAADSVAMTTTDSGHTRSAPTLHQRHLSSEGGLGTTALPSSDGETSSNNSCPDIQSFPLDETCVYSHSPQTLAKGSLSVTAAKAEPSLAGRGAVANESASGIHSSGGSVKKKSPGPSNNYPTTAMPAPHVPKRTVSRLTNVENGHQPKNQITSMPHFGHHPMTASSNGTVVERSYYGGGNGGSGGLPSSVSSDGGGGTNGPPTIANTPASCTHNRNNVAMSTTAVSSAGSYRIVAAASGTPPNVVAAAASPDSNSYTVNEVIRKRHYRTGLNIFNKKPEKGISYLIRRGFLENSPQAVARFLITRKGLSKQMIGEYLGNLTYSFNMAVLNCFALEMDFSQMQIDTALRKFQTYFRMPGEAQKIERLMEVFSSRYCQCNPDMVAKLHSNDTTFILAFAIILLNTDLHTPSLKPEKRMKVDDFVRNLRGIDDGHDLDHGMLVGIYERIRNQEFRPGSDHVSQVIKVQQTIVSKCPNLAIPHRRLVCYCRLYEVPDPYKKERPGIHQREVFLFNDILVITKIHSRKKNTVTYSFRQNYLLAGMVVNLFETQFYPFGIQLVQKWDRKIALMLNGRNEHDRSKFVEDLRESIAEMDEMETLRLEAELEKQRVSVIRDKKRDSGLPLEAASSVSSPTRLSGASASASARTVTAPGASAAAATVASHGASCVVDGAGAGTGKSNHNNNGVLRRSAINNSLLDLSDATAEKLTRRGSVGSLDSGMSVSFQSNSVAGSFSIGGAGGPAAAAAARGGAAAAEHQPSARRPQHHSGRRHHL